VQRHRTHTLAAGLVFLALPNVPLQVVVGGKAERLLHVAFFQRLVELRLGKGRVTTEDYLLAPLLLPLDLWQQQFPAVGAVNIAGP
jgi:hypothetical protein